MTRIPITITIMIRSTTKSKARISRAWFEVTSAGKLLRSENVGGGQGCHKQHYIGLEIGVSIIEAWSTVEISRYGLVMTFSKAGRAISREMAEGVPKSIVMQPSNVAWFCDHYFIFRSEQLKDLSRE